MTMHIQTPVIDPATAVIATLRREILNIDQAAKSDNDPAEQAAWVRWNAANAALAHTEPTTIDGVISYLQYIIDEDDNGTDLSCLVSMLSAAVRGLQKMRAAS
jgi:hypothetical protein